jgi:hypothetical protein
MTVTDDFEDALELIYEALGCVAVARKPTLSYKLSTATLKSLAISLSTEADWEGLIEDVIGAHAKKAKAARATMVSVSILIPEQVSRAVQPACELIYDILQS